MATNQIAPWAAFLSALTNRGLTFEAVALTSDPRSVIHAAGFREPFDIAIIETAWRERTAGRQATATGSGLVNAPPAGSPPLSLLAMPAASSLQSVPGEVADAILADECLHAVLGYSGAFITVVPPTERTAFALVMSQDIPATLRIVIEPVVRPLAQSVLALQEASLAECNWRSVVNMAVGEVLREVCCTYKRDIKTLTETLAGKPKPLALVLAQVSQIGYYVVRLAQVFEGDCDPSKGKVVGAKMLDHLFDHFTRAMGSADDADLLNMVLRRAAAPYLEIMRRWVNLGVLNDPHQEFFVQEQDFQATMDPRILWEQRFLKRKNDVPVFLRREQVEGIVLMSGKLCHTLRACGAPLPAVLMEDEAPWQWTDATEIVATIMKAHELSSQALQGLIIDNFSLIERLSSLKHYFLHDRGDWLAGFLDAAASLIVKPPSQVKGYTLNVILQAEIAKGCTEDRFHTDVGCSLTETTFLTKTIAIGTENTRASMGRISVPVGATHDNRRCIDHLQLEYTCPWPVPIVVDSRFVGDLNIVFRLLLRLKVTERALHSSRKRLNAPTLVFTPTLRRMFALSLHLQQFVTQFQFHATHAVIEPNWAAFILAVKSSATLREIAEAKKRFITLVYQGLGLSSKQRVRAFARIIDVAQKFCVLSARLEETSSRSGSMIARSAAAATSAVEEEAVTAMQHEFTQLLSELARAEDRDSGAFMPFLVMLDFNGFYERAGIYRVRPGVAAENEAVAALLGSTLDSSRRSASQASLGDSVAEDAE